MPLDPSIILQGRGPDIANPLDLATKALNMKQLAQKAQLQDQEIASQNAVRDAYRQNVVTNLDGSMGVNMKGVINTAMQTNPQAGVGLQQTAQANELAQKQAQMKMLQDQTATAHELSMSMQDPNSYAAARQKGIELGLPNADQLPPNFDPKYVQQLQMKTMSAKDQLDQHNKDREFGQKTDELKIKHEENAIKRDQLSSDKVDKYTKDMKNDLDADKGRAGNFGVISAKVQSAQRLQALKDAYAGGNLPPAQMEEFALGLSNMLAPGGGGSREQVKALVPSSAIGDTNKLASWLSNEPRGAGQQAFVKQMADTVDREAGVANDQLNSIRASRVSAHSRLRQVAPAQFNSILQSYGMDPANVDKSGNYKVPPKAPAGGPVLKTHEIEWAD